ncbi:MAG: AAA family ATPase [Bacteroidetes bacterium 4572_112]|nr:MAG: AAA family ATPase [Bacteroidetes bacterium 4572_112]
MINRDITSSIKNRIKNSNRIVIIYGARQLGKTTLALSIIKDLKLKTLHINADLQKHHDILSSRDLKKLKDLTEGYDLLFIDEAQRIKNLGINLKILHDELPQIKVLVTGSSSFDIAYQISDSLAGRKWIHTMYPLSLHELNATMNKYELQESIDDFMTYGLYPEVYTTKTIADKIEMLEEIVSSYLYKDVLELSRIRNSVKIHQLLELLAYRIGTQISINKLSQELEMSRDAVIHYLDLLEKSFVIYKLKGYSKNLSKEVRKKDKYYFYDLGIRNMLIEDFRPIAKRQDVGAIWENFIIMERIKYQNYRGDRSKFYFWRVYTGGEVDFVEVLGKQINGLGIKYGSKIPKPSKTWLETYPQAKYSVINRENFLDFLL